MRLSRSAILLLDLDPARGHEQRGVRPCIIVSDPVIIAGQHYPLVGIVPLTGTPGQGALYPALEPGSSGLIKRSYALIDHVRSVDKRRVRSVFGQIRPDEMIAIDEGLALCLGLAHAGPPRQTP